MTREFTYFFREYDVTSPVDFLGDLIDLFLDTVFETVQQLEIARFIRSGCHCIRERCGSRTTVGPMSAYYRVRCTIF